jgi:hypothetical protein
LKLEKKLARKRAADEAKALAAALEMEKKNAPKVNPFAVSEQSPDPLLINLKGKAYY